MCTYNICTLWKVGFVVNIAWVLHTHHISTRTVVLSAEDIPKHILKIVITEIVFNIKVPKVPCPMVSFVINPQNR
jgi:hypothetical protein